MKQNLNEAKQQLQSNKITRTSKKQNKPEGVEAERQNVIPFY